MACELAASHPEDGDILACAARLAQERGKLEQALDYIRLALDIDPDRKGWLDLQKSLKAAYAIPR
jgi:tetratricopeptide (TPR) repeat protein